MKIKIAFAIYIVLIVLGAFSFKIRFFTPTPPEAELIEKSDRLFRLQVPPEIPHGTGSYFRENRQRTGVNESTIVTLPVQVHELYPEINIGVHSASKATPVVDDSGIYIGSDSGWFFAFNFDGSIKWRHYVSRANFGFHSSAAVDDNSVYVGDYFGDLTRFKKDTGEIIWINHVGDTLGASPLLDGNGIVANIELNGPANGFLVRIDRETGQLIWKTLPIGAQSHVSPSYDETNRAVMVGNNANSIMSYEIWGGKNLWRRKVDNKVKSSFASIGDRTHFTTWDGTFYSVLTKNGNTHWTVDLKGRSQSSPSWVPDAKVFVVSSISGVYGVSEDGKIRWHYKVDWVRGKYPSALVVRRQAAPGTKKKSQYLAWIACGPKLLCAFEPVTGKVEARLNIPGDLTGSLSAHKGVMYMALEDAGLYAIKAIK